MHLGFAVSSQFASSETSSFFAFKNNATGLQLFLFDIKVTVKSQFSTAACGTDEFHGMYIQVQFSMNATFQKTQLWLLKKLTTEKPVQNMKLLKPNA